MIAVIESFSIRAAPVHELEQDSVVVRGFSAGLDPQHDVQGDMVVAESFNAGVQIRHKSEGDEEAVTSFGLVPSGYMLAGTIFPEHRPVETDIIRYHSNG